jgi:NhaP-type Na+/H+ or K+/H+ antiporter
VQNGKIVEIWNNRDDLTTWREFGLFRWYVIGGFVAGVLTTLLGSWLLRRWRMHRKSAMA